MEAAMKKEAETVCVLCCQEIDVFAVGKCDHPVCYRCSTKMRVLCEQKYCAVCRVELDKVIFVRELRPFAALSPHELQTERKYDIYFADRTIFALFRKILLCECLQCPEPKVFSKFEELEQHMRKQHELFCCKLCAKHLKLFSYERKWYNRKELARHRTHGDPDDTSHRGHPLCKFCDDRYLDNDELLKHLRRDHYFCHFCDADGAQEYYCDYRDLSDHFRESHFLCEEGRCRTEQFTHAFRTEIDYKAHKAAAHSKNRAEARQNRQIDIQFNYAPRQQRRNDGLVSADDYEEVDRFNRQGRSGRGRPQGLHQNVRSWRYNREEEDKDLAAAILASQAARRQTERGGQVHERGGQVHERGGQVHERGGQVHERGGQVHERGGQVHERGGQVHERGGQVHERGGQVHERGGQVHERGGQKPRKEEPVEGDELRVNRGAVKPHSDMQGRSTNNNVPLMGEDFPVLGAGAPPLPIHNMVKPNPVSLKEDDFPSLVHSGTSSARMTPAYVPQARKHSSFQEEDFPALVSKIRPHKPQENTTSAWSQVGSKSSMLNNNKPVVLPTKTYSHTAPVFSASDPPPSSAVPQTHGSRRKKVTSLQSTKATSKGKSLLSSDDEDPQAGKMFQENRAVPTMLDISSLLTVKTGSSLPSNKNGRKKKQPSATPSGTNASNLESVTTAAHKENVPETKPPDGSVPKSTGAPKSNKFINGYKERPKETKDTILPEEPPAPKKQPCSEAPAALEEEDFPALTTKKPPPGFKSTFSMKNIQTQLPPPPPPGLGPVISKPPPGFTGVPLDSNVTEYTVPVFNRPAASLGTYHMPENFNQRNIDLIQSIQNFLQNDESKFNEFKNYSGQFRQGLMSAAQYHKSCHELLGENFSRVFNELLVLLPDTQKQQELLTAHADFKATEKQQPGSKGKKNKKKAWQTCTNTNSLDLDCQVCPTCRQVLAPKDFSAHMSLHNGDDDFPSLQAVSKIIS